jgi:hypothetical protein
LVANIVYGLSKSQARRVFTKMPVGEAPYLPPGLITIVGTYPLPAGPNHHEEGPEEFVPWRTGGPEGASTKRVVTS